MADPLDLSAQPFKVIANAGDDAVFAFEFENVNTTGFTFELVVYNSATSPNGTVFATLTEGNGIVNTPGSSSLVTCTISSTDTGTVTPISNKLMVFRRIDTGSLRTYGRGQLELR